MQCPSCGSPMEPGSPSCAECGADDGAASSATRRPFAVTLLAVGDAAVGAGVLALAMFLAFHGIVDAHDWESRIQIVLFAAGFFGPFTLLPLAVAIGLWRLRSWARNLQLLLGCAALFYCGPLLLFVGFSGVATWLVGAVAASVMAALVYLSRPGVRHLFSGRPGRGGVVLGAFVLVAHALGTFILPTRMHRSVSAHEAATIGDIRTVISAQAAYAEANGGYYDSLQCLGEPVRCLPGYKGSHFLDSVLASAAPESGYARTFHPGPVAPPDALAAGRVSASSLRSYAYVAVPVKTGRTGVRGFCGDSTGALCSTADGTPPRVQEGLCVHREWVERGNPAAGECQTLR